MIFNNLLNEIISSQKLAPSCPLHGGAFAGTWQVNWLQ